MRVWAEVYDENGDKLGNLTAIKSARVTQMFDGAGSYSLDVAIDERTIAALVNDLEVRIWVQTTDDVPATEWTRGLIRDVSISDSEGGATVTISGPDMIDQLTDTTVGIGRSYTNQSIQTIVNSLLSLDGTWSATIEADTAADLQTTRFDGANVLRCLLRMVEEKGVHLRNGSEPNTLEIGAFGDVAVSPNGLTVRAIKPPSVVDYELLANDGVILIDRITQTQKSDDVVNWLIPIGAGEGSAALTLRDTTYAIYNEDGTLYRAGTTSRYPIYRRVNANSVAEYYIDASDGGRMRQATMAFKEIGTVANNTTAKQLAANALAQAAMAFLDRQKIPLVSYKISAKNVQAEIKPGHLLPTEYQGRIEVQADETRSAQPRLTYIDVNESLWVMKTTKKISDGQLTYDFDVSTVDRYLMDHTKIMVSMMEAIQARNVGVQTFPFGFQDSSERIIQGSTLPSDAQYKTALFSLQIPDIFTDVISVTLRVLTRPLYSVTDVGPDNFSGSVLQNLSYFYAVYPSPNYPSDITLKIDGVDRTTELGGPWNPSAGNAAVDVTLDISSYIVNAAGGLYQNHTLEFAAGFKSAETRVNTSHNSSTSNASNGIVEAKILFLGTVRAVVPEPSA